MIFLSYLEFSRRWDFEHFQWFLQGHHGLKAGLGIIGNEHMENYHFCPQDAPNLGFDLKLPGGRTKAFSARSYRRLAKIITCDKEAMMVSVGVIPSALRYASKDLRDDIDLVMRAVQKDPFTIDFASKRLRDEKQVVMAAVVREGYVLTYVSERFRDDNDVMRAAVAENGYMLRYASERLKDDIEIVRLAVGSHPDAIRHASKRIRENLELLLNEEKDTRMAVDDAIASAIPFVEQGEREARGRDMSFGQYPAR